MKKSLIVACILMVTGMCWGQSYKTAIGVKFGYPYWGSFDIKHDFGGAYGEFRVGGSNHDFILQGLFEKNYEIQSGFEWYWGVGGHVGFWNYGYNNGYYNKHNGKYYDSGAYVGVDAVLGLEYTFTEIPLNLAIDFGPSANLAPVGYVYFWGGFAVRYAIK